MLSNYEKNIYNIKYGELIRTFVSPNLEIPAIDFVTAI